MQKELTPAELMLEELEKWICPKVIIATRNGELTIIEDAPDSDIRNLTIHGIPTHCLAFTLDYQPKRNRACFQQVSCYLNRSQKNINKHCDCVIITEFDGSWYILLLELKSKKPKRSDIEKQLKNSEAFVRYLFDLLKIHDKHLPNHEYQRVAVTTKDHAGVQKGSVTPGKNQPYFEMIPLKPKNRNANVHLGKLLHLRKL